MNIQPNVLIRASAGTGKTFQLSNRFLILLHQGVSPDEILATTFTRKAAGEILDRVMVRLATAAMSDAAGQRLASELGLDALSHDACLVMLRSLIRHLHRLRICTLDAFFAQLAGSFSLELGLPSGWHIIEALHDRYLRTAAIEATLQGDSLRDVTRLVSLMTKGDAQRSISDLVDGTVSQHYNLFLETDRDAWYQVPRPHKLNEQTLADTIEALQMVDLPTHKKIKVAHENSLEVARAGDWESFVSKGIPAKLITGEVTYYGKELAAETIDVYRRMIGHARAVLLEQLAQQTEATHQLLQKFHDHYAKLKHQSRGLRFEDITRCLAQQKSRQGIDQQHYRLDGPLSHLLLDEFQDTSLSQWQVLQPFAEHVVGGQRRLAADVVNKGRSFFCVGDAKQAIYGWRGGRSEIFEALNHEFESLQHATLSKSYRSAQPVIDTVNQMFTHMVQHPNLGQYQTAVERWCDHFPRHETARQELGGYVELRTTPRAGDDQDQSEVTTACAADWIQEQVRRSPNRSIGVLVRKNAMVAQMIYQLRARGIPASEEGGNPLTDSVAVQLILSLFRLADHPGDTVARFHLAHSPLADDCQLAGHQDRSGSYRLSRQVRRELMDCGYGPTVHGWVDRLLPSCNRRDRNRLAQLVELAYRYQPFSSLRTTDFLKYVEGERVADPTSAEVRVMTIHQAKGLQFDTVVLVELEGRLVGQPGSCVVGQPSPTEPINRVCRYRNMEFQQLLPKELQKLFETTDEQAVQEALCVLYVSLTRPVHALQMFIAPSAENEKKLPRTAAGLLRAALTTGDRLEPDTTVFRTGDPKWHQAMAMNEGEPDGREQDSQATVDLSLDGAGQASREQPSDASTVAVSQPVSYEPAVRQTIQLAPPLVGARPRHQAPSHLEGGSRVAAARILDLSSSVAMQRGTLLHAWFQQIDWLDQGQPEPSLLQRIAEQQDTANLDVTKLLDRFFESLKKTEIQAVLSQSFYQPSRHASLAAVVPDRLQNQTLRLEVHQERRFVVRDQQRLMSGSIDRLVLLYDQEQLVAADVIDYKTDKLDATNSAELEQRVRYYQPQLDAYRAAVSTMFHLDPSRISARLLFVSCGVVAVVE